MTDYLDRLEREILAAGRRLRENAATPASRKRPLSSRIGRLQVILSVMTTVAVVAVVAVVIAVVIAVGAIHRSAHRPAAHDGSISTHRVTEPSSKILTAPACRLRHTHDGLPPLIRDNGTPGAALGSILKIARQPAAGNSLAKVGSFDRDPVDVLSVFRRFVRVVNGERGTRLAFFPAIVCDQIGNGISEQRPLHIRIQPTLAMVMVVLSNPPPRTAILVGSASAIRSGPALPGLDLPDSRGWIQATVVPNGVARVVMHFTPPFLHHYTASVTIRDNIGIVVRNPDYTPTTVSWYSDDGRLIHTFVDKPALRYDRCLHRHSKRCM